MAPILKSAAGHGLLVLGALGLLVPVVPGIPLLAAGAAILGQDHPTIRPWVARIGRWKARWRG